MNKQVIIRDKNYMAEGQQKPLRDKSQQDNDQSQIMIINKWADTAMLPEMGNTSRNYGDSLKKGTDCPVKIKINNK